MRNYLLPGLVSLLCAHVFAEAGQPDFSAFTPVKISSDQFRFVEGPAWDGEDLVYFTDIPNNAIHTYSLKKQEFTLFLEESQGTNGLLFSRDGLLLLCQQDSGMLGALDLNSKKLTALVESYAGKRFNRPNDLVMDKSGGIYFTDPSWSQDRPQAIKGVYYLSATGELTRLVEDMDKPNGIILSPDEKVLYVVDSANYAIRRYKVNAPGKLAAMKVFAELDNKNIDQPSNADGLAIDTEGRLYVSYRFGVSVFDKSGEHLGTIKLAEGPSNLEFAGKEMNILFITAHTNLYKAVLPVTGVRFPR